MDKPKKREKLEDVEIQVKYTDDCEVKTGSVEAGDKTTLPQYSVCWQVGDSVVNKDYSFSTVMKDDASLLINDLKKIAKEGNFTPKETYDYLVNFLKENKDNVSKVMGTIISLNYEMLQKYDSEKKIAHVADSQPEFLDKILNSNDEELNGLICSSIHDFSMKVLHDAGIEAVVVNGLSYKGTNHAALMYKLSDGRYAFSNYDNSVIIEAGSLKDALRTAYKRSPLFKNWGYLSFVDEKGSYTEYAFKDEAAFGQEFDKAFYNNDSPFDINISQKTGIKSSAELSQRGNVRVNIEAQKVKKTDTVQKESGLSLEYRKTDVSNAFDKSKSFGVRFDNKILKNKKGTTELYFGSKNILSYTDGLTSGRKYASYFNSELIDEYTEQVAKMSYQDCLDAGFSPEDAKICSERIYSFKDIMFKSSQRELEPDYMGYLSYGTQNYAGYKKKIYDGENTDIHNAGKVSLVGGMTCSTDTSGFSGDARLAVEEGLGMTNRIGKVTLDTNVSAGMVADLRMDSVTQKFLMQTGTKVNAGTSVYYKPNSAFEAGAYAKGYAVITKPATDTGVEGGIFAAYDNGKTTYFGSASASVYSQDLSLGGFSGKSERTMALSTTLGAQVTPRTSVSLSYCRFNDALNSSRNKNSVMLGTNIKF